MATVEGARKLMDGVPQVEKPVLEKLVLTTDSVEPHRRTWYASEIIGEALACGLSASMQPNTAVAEPAHFFCRAEILRIGHVRLSRLSASPYVVERSARSIGRDRNDGFSFGLKIVGRAEIAQGSNAHLAEAGDVAVMDLTKPGRMTADRPFDDILISLPRHAIGEGPPLDDFIGHVISGRLGLGLLVRRHVLRLLNHAEAATPERLAELSQDTEELLLAALDPSPVRLERLRGAIRREQMRIIREHVEAHAVFGAVEPAHLAKRLGVSEAYVRQLLLDSGTSLEEFVADVRVESCRRAFDDPRFADLSSRDIAHAFGFDSYLDFVRAHVRRHGVTPDKVRLEPVGRITRPVG